MAAIIVMLSECHDHGCHDPGWVQPVACGLALIPVLTIIGVGCALWRLR